MARATNSLPVPDSPEIRTVKSQRAATSMCSSKDRIGADSPTIPLLNRENWKQNSSATTYFLYDGITPVVELDSSGAVTTTTFGAAGVVSRRSGSASVFYSFDSEGNVSQRSDSSGNVLASFLFSAHGTVLSGTVSEPFGYEAVAGYFTDSETGQHLLTNRYHDPQTGRFLTRDPISYSGGINLYAYVGNNPTNAIDPLGLEILTAKQYEQPILLPSGNDSQWWSDFWSEYRRLGRRWEQDHFPSFLTKALDLYEKYPVGPCGVSFLGQEGGGGTISVPKAPANAADPPGPG